MSDSLLFAFLVSVLTLSALSSACYIQNCPRGGKREQPEPIRECMSCGPGLSGRCFGPGICCSKALGCFMRSPDTLVCVQEDQRPGACEPAHTPCGERGRCAAPGLCCDAESCSMDPECSEETRFDEEKSDGSIGEELKSFSGETLLRLLQLAQRRHSAF